MVMITVARFFTFYRFYNDLIDFLASGNAAQMGPAMLMMMGYLVALLLLYAVMFIAVVQLALGARTAPALDSFRLRPAGMAHVPRLLCPGRPDAAARHDLPDRRQRRLLLVPAARLHQGAAGALCWSWRCWASA